MKKIPSGTCDPVLFKKLILLIKYLLTSILLDLVILGTLSISDKMFILFFL